MVNNKSDSSSERNPVEALAEEFLDRLRRGQRPALTEYTDKHPELADEIRDLFPALVMMEDVRPGEPDATGAFQPLLPESHGVQRERLGEYRILREVGRGGMGVVYEAVQESLGRHVALKVLPSQALANPQYLERFRREARAAGRLHHTNIVPVFGTGECDGVHFYAMQFIQGQGLDLVLQDVRRLRLGKSIARERIEDSIAGSLVSGQFAVASAPSTSAVAATSTTGSGFSTGSEHAYHRSVARVGLQVAEALSHAHKQGVLHRDVKPSNLLLDLQGNTWVTDFGLAKAEEGGDLTTAGDIVGTIRYMAPERFDGRSLPESDVYGLGITLYELLTLKPAFEEPNRGRLIEHVLHDPPVSPRRFDRLIPRDLETIVLKCVAKEPKDRYATAEALAEDLRRYLNDRPIVGRRSAMTERTWRWCRRNPVVASLLAFVVLLLVGVSVASSLAAVRFRHLAADEKQARREAEDAGAAERWERYRSNIAAASAALQMENSSAARRALEAAPEAHRNWEWRHLHNQLDSARAVLRGHAGSVTRCRLSRDGRRLASFSGKDFTVRLWDVTTGREVARLRQEGATEMAVNPDGTRLAIGAADGLSLWDTATGARASVLLAGRGIRSVTWAPDGRHVAACTERDPSDVDVLNVFRVWDAATGRLVASANGNHIVPAVAFRPDGRRVARTLGGGVFVWDLDASKEAVPLAGERTLPTSVAYSPDGRLIAAGYAYAENVVRLWEANTGRLIGKLPGHANSVDYVTFSPDGTRLASCSMDSTIRLWDTATMQTVANLRGHTGGVRMGAFSPDGRRFLSASSDQTLRLWDAVTGERNAVLRGHDGTILWATITPDGRTFVSASEDGTVRLWDADLAERQGVLTGHTRFVYDVAISPDGRRLASAAWDGTVRLWDPNTGEAAGVLRPASPPKGDVIVGAVAFSPDGRQVASVQREGGVTLWDLATGQPERVISVPTGNWTGDARVAFNPAGTLLAVGSSEGIVRLIDPATGAVQAALTGPDPALGEELTNTRDVAFSPDGHTLAVTGFDRTIRLWDVATRTQRRVLTLSAPVYAIAFSRDGRLLAAAEHGGNVRLWDGDTYQELATLPHRGSVHALAFSPDGTRLATACADSSIRLWDVVTRQEVAELRGHAGYVHAVAWSPDGTRLFSGSGDKTVRVWDSLSVSERAEREADAERP